METHNLNMLISLAVTARDAAAVERARAQQQVNAARAQLEVLHSYVNDYAQRAQQQLSDGCDVVAQRNTRAFGGRLDQAIEAQLAELKSREAQLGRADSQWRELAQRVQRLELLVTRREQAARVTAGRREQKSTDEFARAAAQRRATRGTEWS